MNNNKDNLGNKIFKEVVKFGFEDVSNKVNSFVKTSGENINKAVEETNHRVRTFIHGNNININTDNIFNRDKFKEFTKGFTDTFNTDEIVQETTVSDIFNKDWVTLKVSRLYRDVILPKKRLEDSGYDVCAYLGYKKYITVMPGETVKIGTGLSFEIPNGYDLKVYLRSSVGYNGLISMATVIDQGYQGEAHLCIYNSSNKPIVIINSNNMGNVKELKILKDIATVYSSEDGLFQFILEPRTESNLKVVDKSEIHLGKTSRGIGGFGSTNIL